jgi:DNA-directed RNA polymerase specialized sigma subunit
MSTPKIDPLTLRHRLISQCCLFRGVTYTQIARSLNVSKSMVTMVARGQRVSKRVQRALAKQSGVPYKELWG